MLTVDGILIHGVTFLPEVWWGFREQVVPTRSRARDFAVTLPSPQKRESRAVTSFFPFGGRRIYCLKGFFRKSIHALNLGLSAQVCTRPPKHSWSVQTFPQFRGPLPPHATSGCGSFFVWIIPFLPFLQIRLSDLKSSRLYRRPDPFFFEEFLGFSSPKFSQPVQTLFSRMNLSL